MLDTDINDTVMLEWLLASVHFMHVLHLATHTAMCHTIRPANGNKPKPHPTHTHI